MMTQLIYEETKSLLEFVDICGVPADKLHFSSRSKNIFRSFEHFGVDM